MSDSLSNTIKHCLSFLLVTMSVLAAFSCGDMYTGIINNKGIVFFSAPELNNLTLSRTDSSSITLVRPSMAQSGIPAPAVMAYIGIDGVIASSGPAVMNAVEGPVDVSGADYQFKNLRDDTPHRIIVVAQNIMGYSAREIAQSTGVNGPLLNDLSISRSDVTSITLAMPTLSYASRPVPTVMAYIGLRGTISAYESSVSSYLQGPVDVSGGGTTFSVLDSHTEYTIIVVASNSVGYSVKEITIMTQNQIIADHTVIDKYDIIPAAYLSEVKKMMVAFPGESHSVAYRTGMELLEAINPDNACNVATGEAPTDRYVRVNNSGAGEATWYTWYAYDNHAGSNMSVIKNMIAEYVNHGHPINALGFAWCWDTTYHNMPTAVRDPVYGCGWAGASDGGPDGDLAWGLDADDYAITGNRVSMDTYLFATEEYRLYCLHNNYPTRIIFTTSPADGATGESGYQGYLKHEHIRNYVKANPSRILFDYSDILCYDDDGTRNTVTWNSHTYPHITDTNAGDGSVGHIGSAGAIRLAKAQWWLLARIAGWDGN